MPPHAIPAASHQICENSFSPAFNHTPHPVAGKVCVEQVLELRHLFFVRTLRTVIVALLALAWVPLTSHCILESIPGLEFLRCACDTQLPSSSGDPCQDDGCCAVESAQYQSPRQQDLIPIVVFAIIPAEVFGVLQPSLPPEVSLGIVTSAPPDLTTSWQFSLRTALPVRAPSFAS